MKLPKVPRADCVNCPLAMKPIAPSNGRLDAPIAIVSRSPGKWDTSAGVPFSGPSGKLLDYLLEKYGKSRDDVFVTNVVLCLSDNLDPKAVECCRPRLDYEIDTLLENGVEVIIAGGSEATEWFLGDASVKKYRGRRIPVGGTELVVTFNPAAALHQPAMFPDLEADIRRALTPPPPYEEPTIHITNDRDIAGDFISTLRSFGLLAADIEATGLSQFSSLVSCSFAGERGTAYTFGRDLVSDNEWRATTLRPFLESDIRFSWHNGKYDTKVLRNAGIAGRVSEDTLLLSYCLDERPGVHSLDYCLQNYLGWPYYTPPIVEWGKKNKFAYPLEVYEEAMQEVYKYNGMDAVGGFQLYEYLSERLKVESDGYA